MNQLACGAEKCGWLWLVNSRLLLLRHAPRRRNHGVLRGISSQRTCSTARDPVHRRHGGTASVSSFTGDGVLDLDFDELAAQHSAVDRRTPISRASRPVRVQSESRYQCQPSGQVANCAGVVGTVTFNSGEGNTTRPADIEVK